MGTKTILLVNSKSLYSNHNTNKINKACAFFNTVQVMIMNTTPSENF